MKYSFAFAIGLFAVSTVAPAFADTNNVPDVGGALAKLEAAPNYSWTVTIKLPNAPFTPSPVSGSTEKDGYSMVSQDFNGNTMQVVFKGDKVAVKGQDDWQTMADADDQTAMAGGWLINRGTPAAEARLLLKDTASLSVDKDGAVGGDLTSAGATDMMTYKPRNGNPPPAPKDAKGWVKFWLNSDGTLAKFESHLDAQVAFGDDQQPQDFEVFRTVEVKDVGSTKVAIPDGAMKAFQPKAAAN